MGEIFNLILINPITNLLIAIYNALLFLHIPYALGFSIIVLTALIRLLLWPVVAQQIKATKAMQRMAPHIAAIKEKHKSDKKRQQEETMKLYKEHGVNPVGGCLPALVQIPIFISLYRVLTHIVSSSSAQVMARVNGVVYFGALKVNHAIDTTFFGLPLATVPKNNLSHEPWLILIPIVTGFMQFILSKMMMPEEVLDAKQVLAKKTPQKSDDFQAAMQKQTLFIFPIMIGFFSFTLPVGLSLYWNTFSLFGILQQYILAGPGGLKPWLAKIKK
jgi:YidC/Oxa1 family membrane protein insertase